MAAVIMMSSMNANAADRPRDKRSDRGNRMERRMERRMEPRREPRHPYKHRYDIRGYEDRVRFHNNRWHYHRDGRWYSYDHYIAPSYYYSQPLSKFGKAVVGAAVVGAVISALVS